MLAQPLLKKLLPSLSQMVHDPSARVRKCFYEMLFVIRGLKDIKFFDIVPVSHLLARLSSVTASNQKRIAELIAGTYFPAACSDETRLSR